MKIEVSCFISIHVKVNSSSITVCKFDSGNKYDKRVFKDFNMSLNKKELACKAVKKYTTEDFPVNWNHVENFIGVELGKTAISLQNIKAVINPLIR